MKAFDNATAVLDWSQGLLTSLNTYEEARLLKPEWSPFNLSALVDTIYCEARKNPRYAALFAIGNSTSDLKQFKIGEDGQPFKELAGFRCEFLSVGQKWSCGREFGLQQDASLGLVEGGIILGDSGESEQFIDRGFMHPAVLADV